MSSKAIYSSALVLVVFLRVNCEIGFKEELRVETQKICQILKPNGIFHGIKVLTAKTPKVLKRYDKITANFYSFEFMPSSHYIYMYSDGKQWANVLDDSKTKVLYPVLNTLTTISSDPVVDNWNSNWDQLVLFKQILKKPKTGEHFYCYIIRTKPQYRRWCSNGVNDVTAHTTSFESNSLIAFTPTLNTNLLAVIDPRNSSDVMFYDIFADKFIGQSDNDCPKEECVVPKFLSDIPEEMLFSLKGISHLFGKESKINEYLFLVFNINYRPLFCVFPSNINFTEGCSEDKLYLFGSECKDSDKESVAIKSYLLESNWYYFFFLLLLAYISVPISLYFGYRFLKYIERNYRPLLIVR